MPEMRYQTGTSGRKYVVDQPCRSTGCDVGFLHHMDEAGKHYCPTGFLWCRTHGEVVGTFEGPADCAQDDGPDCAGPLAGASEP